MKTPLDFLLWLLMAVTVTFASVGMQKPSRRQAEISRLYDAGYLAGALKYKLTFDKAFKEKSQSEFTKMQMLYPFTNHFALPTQTNILIYGESLPEFLSKFILTNRNNL